MCGIVHECRDPSRLWWCGRIIILKTCDAFCRQVVTTVRLFHGISQGNHGGYETFRIFLDVGRAVSDHLIQRVRDRGCRVVVRMVVVVVLITRDDDFRGGRLSNGFSGLNQKAEILGVS